ncbi:MAG: FliI/YscN family ATPase [Nocardioidaceae bacterium]
MTATQVLAQTLSAERVHTALQAARPIATGQVVEAVGLSLLVRGVDAAVGDLVEVGTGRTTTPLLAEVAAATVRGLICLPLGSTTGVAAGDPVLATGAPLQVPVGPALLGRVLDGLGRPLDGGPSLDHLPRVPVEHQAPEALTRSRIDAQVGLGVRALDALIPCGRGQRLGIMAGSGVGKSTLLSLIARNTRANVCVVALVGERGREVREFLENDLGADGLSRSVVVVATSDAPPVERLRAAFVATRIAESFRDQGADVVLMMDSLTRVAMAQREVGLSAGEPPATRGYPPSVFALLARLVERAGPARHGSITGLYTILVEGDDIHDPIGDSARSYLDGHVVLSRRLASAGHYPSIDVLGSVSRLTSAVTDDVQQADATEVRRLLAAHADVRELVEIGAYVAGTNPVADRALALKPALDAFCRQRVDEHSDLADTWSALHELVSAP